MFVKYILETCNTENTEDAQYYLRRDSSENFIALFS
jgi:hypothetical protein